MQTLQLNAWGVFPGKTGLSRILGLSLITDSATGRLKTMPQGLLRANCSLPRVVQPLQSKAESTILEMRLRLPFQRLKRWRWQQSQIQGR
jgi:hypothetical protein